MIFHLFKGIFFDRLLTNHLSCKNALKIEIWTLKNKKNDTFLNQREISIKTLNKTLIFLRPRVGFDVHWHQICNYLNKINGYSLG